MFAKKPLLGLRGAAALSAAICLTTLGGVALVAPTVSFADGTSTSVSDYFSPASECEAAGIDVKAGAPDLLVGWNGGSQTVQAGDNFRVDTTASAVEFTVSVKADASNKTTLSVKALQGNECPAADPDTDGDGYTDAAEKAAGSDLNDPKSTPVDLDGDGVLNDADKCPGTKADAKVDKDGCSKDQQTPPSGNKGTLKVHEQGTPSGTESNDPKVCSFNLEGYKFTPGQTGYVMFDVQGGDGPTGTSAGPYDVGPANGNGYFETQYFSLTNGHYKATLYGKKLPSGQLEDEKAKSKVFKVECLTPVKDQYALVLWKVDESRAPYTSGMPLWPQDYVKSVIPVDTKPTATTIKDAFPNELKGDQKCVAYQGDGYKYTTSSDKAKVDGLVSGGVLTDYADSSIYLAHAYYVNSDCSTPKTKVTAVNGIFTDLCGPDFNLGFTPAVTEGVEYVQVREGNTLKVTAKVTDPAKYELTNPEWFQTATDELVKCPVMEVTVTAPAFAKSTCTKLGVVTATDNEFYAWMVSGPNSAKVYTAVLWPELEGVTLVGQTSWTFDLSKKIGEKCDSNRGKESKTDPVVSSLPVGSAAGLAGLLGLMASGVVYFMVRRRRTA